ncbi:MAG: hypothetical protein MMC33_010550 [Icmadophila ericetorum]|nr:hypothetical protein [Icmadophila ericetorum]
MPLDTTKVTAPSILISTVLVERRPHRHFISRRTGLEEAQKALNRSMAGQRQILSLLASVTSNEINALIIEELMELEETASQTASTRTRIETVIKPAMRPFREYINTLPERSTLDAAALANLNRLSTLIEDLDMQIELVNDVWEEVDYRVRKLRGRIHWWIRELQHGE